MPEGLAVLKWDDELGPVVTSKTPKGLQLGLDPTTSMRVYGISTLGETEESQKPGFSSLAFDQFKLGVYYGGLGMHLRGLPSMVFLVLSPDEDPDAYKDALPEIATQIFLNAEDNKYVDMVPKLFKQIARYTQMNPEQRQASVLNDPVRRAIVQSLMKNGTVEYADLEQVVFEEVGKKIDIDMVLRPLVKMGIIATGWVEGLASEVVYLTRAIFILRNVHHETMEAARAGDLSRVVSSKYLETTKKYHRGYIGRLRKDLVNALWSDAAELSAFIIDFEAYDALELLRKGPKTTEQLAKELDIKDAKLRKLVSELEAANIVIAIKDEGGKEYLLLKCDPQVVTVYPEWLITRTAELYNEEEIPGRQATHYLEVLRRFHPSNVAADMTEAD